MTDMTDKVAFAAAELNAASDALASAAAEVDALRAEVARQTGIAVDYCARAGAAEQMVAECCALLADVKNAEWMSRREGLTPSPFWGDEWQSRIDAALSRTEAVAGRWVPAAERDEVMAERDAAIAARDEAVARLDALRMSHDRVVAALAAAERARDEVGIQLAAAQAEIARWSPVIQYASNVHHCYREGYDLVKPMAALGGALRALDAVPGDALAPMVPPSPAGVSAPASGSTPAASSATGSSSEVAANPSAHRGTCDRITAALEANGIDTSNVKGVE